MPLPENPIHTPVSFPYPHSPNSTALSLKLRSSSPAWMPL